MCIKTKDLFITCPHKHFVSVTFSSKEIGKIKKVTCDCNQKVNEFEVVISLESFNRQERKDTVKYWGEK